MQPHSESPSVPQPAPRRRLFLDPRRAVGRFLLSAAVAALTAVLVPSSLGWAVRVVLPFCASATVLLALTWVVIASSDADETRRRCVEEDPGRMAVWLVVVVGCFFSLFAAAGLMRHSQAVSAHGSLLVGLCLWAVASAWCLTHSAFTLRYAHLHYRDDPDDGAGCDGLAFPGSEPPDDLDFAYFAFTIGTCFQTSDVAINDRAIRRTVLLHAVMSFLFNTAILALALNLAFGRLG